MCKCTPEIRTPFCGRGDCLPPGYANLGEWLGEQEAAAQMSLDRVWEQAVQQAMEGHKADPAQAALNWAHNYATKHEPRGSDSDADIAHLIVEQTKRIAELTIENGQLYIQLDRDEWPGLRQQLRQAEERALATIATLTTRAEQAEAQAAKDFQHLQQIGQTWKRPCCPTCGSEAGSLGTSNAYFVCAECGKTGHAEQYWPSESDNWIDRVMASPWGRPAHLAEEIKRLRARVAELTAALGTLIDRLDFIHGNSEYQGVWQMAALHGMPYAGPQYKAELDAARAAMEGQR